MGSLEHTTSRWVCVRLLAVAGEMQGRVAVWVLLSLAMLIACRHAQGTSEGASRRAPTSPSSRPPARADALGLAIADTDREGRLEDEDACVGTRESHNGYMDGDGCPDTPPRGCPYSVSPQVHFPLKRSRSAEELDQGLIGMIAAELADQPEFNVEIRGHAAVNECADEAACIRLGEQRARSVRSELIRRLRFPPDRLVIRSFGTREPFPCGSADELSRHRRVDFGRVPGQPSGASAEPSTPAP